jgi:predicted RNase H-related nuclease YkuK (DUF458 family)
MTEVYKVSDLYLQLAEVLEGRDVEVHLDINPDEMHGSPVGGIKEDCTRGRVLQRGKFRLSHETNMARETWRQ